MEQYITESTNTYINYVTIFIWFIISRSDLFVRYILYITILVLFIFLFTGKSNLMDAISFVLGEKTSNLRVKRLSVSNTVMPAVNHCYCLQTHYFKNQLEWKLFFHHPLEMYF